MKKNTAAIAIVLAAFLLVANLIIVYEGMQAGITKWG